MEYTTPFNKEQEDKNNKKTLANDPEYFGSYLNLARLNIYNISNHIAQKFEIKYNNQQVAVLDDEEKIVNSFLTNYNTKAFKEKERVIFDYTRRFLTISKIFDTETLPGTEKGKSENSGKNIQMFSKALGHLFRAINEFRNNYTHYYGWETETSRITTVSAELKQLLEISFNHGIQYSQQRFKEVLSAEDFELASKTILVNADNTITQDGMVFLIALFLDRENAFQFIGKVVGLKGTQKNSFLAKREALMAYCLRLPNDKFVSDNIKQAFSLDLINELSKCPKELYHVITETEQEQFHPKIQNALNIIENSVPDSVEDFEAYIQSISKRVRQENRFSFFALKYLDINETFKKIRFQIDLGKITLDKYSKILAGQETEREVVEDAKAFKRLQDLQEENTVLGSINKSTQNLKFRQFAPHYNFDNNKIGISLSEQLPIFTYNPQNGKQVKGALKQPVIDAFLSIHELPKILLLDLLHRGKAETIIEEFLTISNSKILNWKFIESIKSKLKHLSVFYKRSEGKKRTGEDHAAYNPVMLEELRARKKALNDLLQEEGLNDKQIPERILAYWLNIQNVDTERAVSDRIKLMKKDCKDRLHALKKQEETGEGKIPKIGEMATFVAKDIVDMIIDPEKKKKITSFYYDKIQECIALYADQEKKALLRQILEDDLKLYDKGGHPFLHKVRFQDVRYTKELYQNYLEEKGKKMILVGQKKTEKDVSWMQTQFYISKFDEKKRKKMTRVGLPDNLSELPVSINRLARPEHQLSEWFRYIMEGKEKTDRKKPIDLPTNLFDDALQVALQKSLSASGISFDSKDNYSKLFRLWWKHTRQDETQSFYAAVRAYEFEDITLNFQVNTKEKFEDYLPETTVSAIIKNKTARLKREQKPKQNLTVIDVRKKAALRIKITEREIRLIQEEDMLMLLMFEKMSHVPNCRLRDIGRLLHQTETIKQSIEGKLYFSPDGTKNINERTSIVKMITEERKRKDYSVLKKYLHDKRLPELFEYFPESVIPLTKLKLELGAYNKGRDIVFGSIFELEKAIITRHKNDFLNSTSSLQKSGKNHIQHKHYLEWLLSENKINTDDRDFLLMTRNTFSHNQFPQKQTMEKRIRFVESEKFALQIADAYERTIKSIIQQL
ncbi:type VI-B CRISPR-associated RNA-guided ribonuclease Cas13b [Rurimicrobium arvi]|uniref:Uncharacterized protein n=1 Tax=Rurimicrobium arvi TaxID=2049916 RepID=A0ABP8MHR0_9BACT